MKKFLKVFKYVLLTLAGLLLIIFLVVYIKMSNASKNNMALLGEEASTLTQNGITFRDLNKNGKLDVYENPNASPENRAADLVQANEPG